MSTVQDRHGNLLYVYKSGVAGGAPTVASIVLIVGGVQIIGRGCVARVHCGVWAVERGLR